MSARAMSLLVSPREVPEDAMLLDATWFMPNVSRDAEAEFRTRHLPRAQRWPVDEIAASHPLGLNASQFAKACSERGISADTPVVIYDTHGLFSSPRTLFTFRAFGHERSAVLDGGMPRWLSEGLPTETGEPKKADRVEYKVSKSDADSFVHDYDAIRASSASGEDLILDARPAGRFHGSDPEPRPGLSSGHMPNSISLPFSKLLSPPSKTDPPFQTLLPKRELLQALVNAIGSEEQLKRVIAGKQKVITTCGSGMTAAVIWLALHVVGADASIYDESWTGYAMRKESPIEKSRSFG